jgi:hypothetical protein
LPLLRRISQIFFLLLFLALLIFTSLRAAPGTTGDIHLRAPVRLFFEWDPLVAVATRWPAHALYRGLLWSLIILLPTLFLGRFFCGWICPMGTLQHFVGNLPSEAKRGKQRIDSNRYKRWQTGKYVVLIAGLVAAVFGSAAIGWLDPFSLLVRSFGLALLPAFNFAVRAGAAPLEHSHIAAIKRRRESCMRFCNSRCSISGSSTLRRVFAGVLFLAILLASLRVTRLWCRSICPLGALLGAVSRWSRAGAAQGCRKLQPLQPLPAPLPGRRRSHWRRALAQVRVPDVHELRRQLPGAQPRVPLLPQGKEVASPDLGRRRT